MRKEVFTRTIFFALFCLALTLLPGRLLAAGMSAFEKPKGEVLFLYGDRDIAPNAKGMTRAWGFAPFVRFDDKVILFNSGGDGEVLRHNMKIAGVKASDIDIMIISHEHWDMYGGAASILKENPKIKLYTTPKVKEILERESKKWNINLVDRTAIITPNILIREMKSMPRHGGRFGILTLDLILKTEDGLVVLGGCGHVNLVDTLKAASHFAHESILHMYIGGTHLLRPGKEVDLPGNSGKYTVPQEFYYADEYILKLIEKLKELGLEEIMPTHCTGSTAEELFHEKFKDGYLNQLLGMKLSIAAPIR